jgi:ABC-type multidrug transport system permease subunit
MLVLTGMALAFVAFEGSGLQLLLTMILSGISAVCIGLFLSTLVSRPESASMPMIILVVIELMASGFVVALPETAKWIYAPIATRWSVEAALDNEREGLAALHRPKSNDPSKVTLDQLMKKQRYATGNRSACFVALIILSLVFMGAAALVLRIRDPVILKWSQPEY